MLKKILSIAGRPGLYKLIGYGKNMIIVEPLPQGKRLPVHSRDRVMSLGDISIFTDSDDVPLSQVFTTIGEQNKLQAIDAKPITASNDKLYAFIEGVLPNYDRDRVHPGDVKKIIQWYNLLIEAGITDFTAKDEEEEKAEEPAEEPKKEEPAEEKPKKAAKKATKKEDKKEEA